MRTVEAINEEIVAAVCAVEYLPYGGEQVDQLQHALQCAALAVANGADDELIVAALLHDVGRSPLLVRDGGSADHGELAQRWLADRTGNRVAWLVGQHVPAKRFLCTIEPGYDLSEPSLRSLSAQGGPMSSDELERFRAHPDWESAVELRRWDDIAKDPAARVAPLASYQPQLRAVIAATLPSGR
jgi:predicted HD phosphohydrolase